MGFYEFVCSGTKQRVKFKRKERFLMYHVFDYEEPMSWNVLDLHVSFGFWGLGVAGSLFG